MQRIGVLDHHHHPITCSVLGIVTCSGPIKSPEAFHPWIPFSQVDISQLSVAVSLSVSLSVCQTCCTHLLP
jgi:hypothetical protein